MVRGARLIERNEVGTQIGVRKAPIDLDGQVIFLPANRTQASSMDYVFLDRGAVHGVEVGTQVVVHDAGSLKKDVVRGIEVNVPSHKVADMVIISVQPTTSAAYVLGSRRELMIGDAVRGEVPTDVAAR